jgi:hypothetical protein
MLSQKKMKVKHLLITFDPDVSLINHVNHEITGLRILAHGEPSKFTDRHPSSEFYTAGFTP